MLNEVYLSKLSSAGGLKIHLSRRKVLTIMTAGGGTLGSGLLSWQGSARAEVKPIRGGDLRIAMTGRQ